MPMKYALFLLGIAMLLIFGAPFVFQSGTDFFINSDYPEHNTSTYDYGSDNLSLHYDQLLKDDKVTVLADQNTNIIDRELYLTLVETNKQQVNALQLQIALLGFEAELVADNATNSTVVKIGPFKSSSERNNFRQQLLKIGIESTIY